MDATQREDMNGISSVANMREKRAQRERDRIESEQRQKRTEHGKRRSKTVAYGMSYSPLFNSFRDQ